ncbi:MAG: hypothetical protein D6723_15470 [Acidobacteria bacterium]|nr:MAG: hypothetical protein D6723_15470 [Acidobacteriota bacterium]
MRRKDKITSLEEAIRPIEDGSCVAIGGLSYFNAPMALVREMIRQRKRNLVLVTAPVAGLPVDMLIGAGCVRRLISPFVTLEEMGLAVNFRRAVEKGSLDVMEIGEAFLAFGLKAGASGSPFYALPRCFAAADMARVTGEYRTTINPFTGEVVVCVPAINPDWVLLHAQQSDPFGNLRYMGSGFLDALLVRAGRRVIASCDELIPHEMVRSEPRATTIPAMMVDQVVPIHGGAHPTSSLPFYEVDRSHIRSYLKSSKTEEGFRAYLDRFVFSVCEPEEYLSKVGGLKKPEPLRVREVELTSPPSVAEVIVTVLSHILEDGDTVGVGTGCWEVAAGVRLAQLTHAPNLSFTVGGTVALNSQWTVLPLSVNSPETIPSAEAVMELEHLFDLELNGSFDVMFVSGLQIDQYGNVNLAYVGDRSSPKLRGPGSAGLEFAPCVKKVVAFFRHHTRQTFVERVDFVSGVGYLDGPQSRRRFDLDEDTGPFLVVTNLAVLDFDPVSKRMRLKSVHPGVSAEEVQKNTGFELVIPEQIETTPLPTEEELKLLRTRIDKGHLLATLIS